MGITTKIIAILVLVLLLIAGGFDVYLAIKDKALSSQVTQLKTDNATLKQNLSDAQTTIVNQNKAIKEAGDKAKHDQDTMKDLGDQLTKQQTTDAKIIANLKKQPAPKTCQDSIKYLNQQLELFQW